METKIDRIIKCSYLITMVENESEPKRDFCIAVDKDTIVDIGPSSEILGKYEAGETTDTGKRIIMPGFINTHGHIPMISYTGKIPDGVAFRDVLFRYMLPLELEFISEDDFIYYSTLLGLCEMASSGVTTSVEMYYNARDMIRAFNEIGLRGVIGETVISEFPSPAKKSAEESLDYIEKLHQEMPSGEKQVELAIAPHSAYSCNDETLIKVKDLSLKLDLPVLMHAQEVPEEAASAIHNTPPPPESIYKIRPGVIDSPMVHMSKIGFFDAKRVLLAHCVYLRKDEIEIIAEKKAGISYNGICNTQIGLDIAPVIDMRKAGIPVGIGTDGPLTNDHTDIISQLLPLLCFQRHRYQSSELLNCYEILKMSTIEGARAIGLSHKIGSLEKGKKADIIGINIENVPRAELYLDNDSIYSFIVKFAASRNIDFCLINGKEPKYPVTQDIISKLKPVLEKIKAWTPL